MEATESAIDDLFTVLEDENLDHLADDAVINGDDEGASGLGNDQVVARYSSEWNRPDPKLMEELGDALAVLPKNVQEMLVRRLITTITCSEPIKGHVKAASALTRASVVESDDEQEGKSQTITPRPQRTQPSKDTPDVTLPLAAATLGALLAQYGAGTKAKSCLSKSFLPVIPVHA